MKKKKINFLDRESINKNLDYFDKNHNFLERGASFDYCFNYFQKFNDKKEFATTYNIQNSCLHLGFYLASWGMYRGSADILQKSVKIFEPVVKYVASRECDVWKIDVDNYLESDNIPKLIKCYRLIEKELEIDQKDKSILVTKVMLGVFGNVPAFDGYFKIGSNLNIVNEYTLKEIYDFYHENEAIIDNRALKTKTFEYHTNITGNRSYTRAKIIDQIFFIEGYRKDMINIKTRQN